MTKMITCLGCGEVKKKFCKGICRKCYDNQPLRKMKTKERRKHNRLRENFQIREHRHYMGINQPLNENKTCSSYLGDLSETILCNYFKNVIRMPYGNKGFDFISDGYKIDAKSGCRIVDKIRNDRWVFLIKKNKIPDYFACLAFDNRDDINIEHFWLIPNKDVNTKTKISISESKLFKWNKYEQNIGDLNE